MSKKRGRKPMFGERMEHISIRLPSTLNDDLCRIAVRDRVSVMSLAREAIHRFVCLKNRQAVRSPSDCQ